MAKQRFVASHAADEQPPARRKPAPRKSSSRLFRLLSRLFILLLLLAILGYFAPLIVARTGLWKQILAAAAPEIAKQIDAKSLQLNWLSPIEIRGLVVRDAAGQPLAEVPLIKSHKPLLAIAPKVPVHTEIEVHPLTEANQALDRLRAGLVRGTAVLVPSATEGS